MSWTKNEARNKLQWKRCERPGCSNRFDPNTQRGGIPKRYCCGNCQRSHYMQKLKGYKVPYGPGKKFLKYRCKSGKHERTLENTSYRINGSGTRGPVCLDCEREAKRRLIPAKPCVICGEPRRRIKGAKTCSEACGEALEAWTTSIRNEKRRQERKAA